MVVTLNFTAPNLVERVSPGMIIEAMPGTTATLSASDELISTEPTGVFGYVIGRVKEGSPCIYRPGITLVERISSVRNLNRLLSISSWINLGESTDILPQDGPALMHGSMTLDPEDCQEGPLVSELERGSVVLIAAALEEVRLEVNKYHEGRFEYEVKTPDDRTYKLADLRFVRTLKD